MQNFSSLIYLVAAMAWACLAVACFFLLGQMPDGRSGVLLGIFAAVMVPYNLFRWWNLRRRSSQPPPGRPWRPTPPRPVRPPTQEGEPGGPDQFPPQSD